MKFSGSVIIFPERKKKIKTSKERWSYLDYSCFAKKSLLQSHCLTCVRCISPAAGYRMRTLPSGKCHLLCVLKVAIHLEHKSSVFNLKVTSTTLPSFLLLHWSWFSHYFLFFLMNWTFKLKTFLFFGKVLSLEEITQNASEASLSQVSVSRLLLLHDLDCWRLQCYLRMKHF